MLSLRLTAILGFVIAASSAAPGDELLVRPLDGEPFRAEIATIDADGRLTFVEGAPKRSILLADVFTIGEPLETNRSPWIVTSDGSRVHARIVGIDAESVKIAAATRSTPWREMDVPRVMLRAVVFLAPFDLRERDVLFDRLTVASTTHDELHLLRGDVLQGRIDSMTNGSLEPMDEPTTIFEFTPTASRASVKMRLDRIAAIRFGAVETRERPSTGAFLLGLRDGTSLLATDLKIHDDRVDVSTPSGLVWASDNTEDDPFIERIAFLQPFHKRIVYLSDLAPTAYKHVPLLAGELPLALDRSTSGGRLRTDARAYWKGLAMPGGSRAAFDVPEGVKRFEADVTIDAAAGKKGSVQFRVLLESAQGEWKSAWESAVMRGGDRPLAVRIELNNARRLALAVDPTDRFDECDWADWLDARFVR